MAGTSESAGNGNTGNATIPSALERLDSIIDEFEQDLLSENSQVPEGGQAQMLETLAITRKLHEMNAAEKYPQNDLGSARLFADVFKDKCRYNPQIRDWMKYDGSRWTQDNEGMYARRMCKVWADSMVRYALEVPLNDQQRKDYLKYTTGLTAARVRNSVVTDARDVNCFTTEELDADDLFLNVLNGTLDLHSDAPVFRPHNPDDLISKRAEVVYDQAADCPLWKQTLDQIFEGDSDKIRYIQKLLGLCLTGITKEEQFYIFYGATSRNGKSTITETALSLLGDYGETINPETLAIKQNKDSRTASPDLAKLNKCRLCVASEPPKRMLFDSSLTKTLTGRDRITARFLHQNEISFTPKFKLLLNTNYLPNVTDSTLFLSGRVQVIEFNRHFSEDEQDKTLKDRLKEELSGILNWTLEGLKLYQREGLQAPECVRQAVASYQTDSDKLGRFITDCLIEAPNEYCAAGEAYKVYEEWTKQNGYGTESKSNFFSDLKTKGLYKDSGTICGKTVRRVIRGYRINDDLGDEITDYSFQF